ncbi:hypothetical protein QUS22_01335 [Wolbachia pipientis]|nr:hypothetical protein [Wolbachia pipientis]
MYHCIKCGIARYEVGDKLSFENLINILDKAIHRFIPPEDFHRLINFQDQSGNTLLHQ